MPSWTCPPGPKEGKLKDGVESYFNTADLEEEINPVASQVGAVICPIGAATVRRLT